MKRRLFILIIVLFFGCGEDENPNNPSKPWWWDHRENVTTLEAGQITATSAIARGMATNDGVLNIFGQGFHVTGDLGLVNYIKVGADTNSGSGIFMTQLEGLKPNTLYGIQAFASTDFSSSTGKVVSFRTLPE
jgi:hypothetical protein